MEALASFPADEVSFASIMQGNSDVSYNLQHTHSHHQRPYAAAHRLVRSLHPYRYQADCSSQIEFCEYSMPA